MLTAEEKEKYEKVISMLRELTQELKEINDLYEKEGEKDEENKME